MAICRDCTNPARERHATVPWVRSYTERTVGLAHRVTEVYHLYRMQSREIPTQVQDLIQNVREMVASIEARLGEPLAGKSVLEIGPGQKLKTAICLARENDVTGIDLDYIVRGFHPGQYWQMLRDNGPVRLAKTLLRKSIA